MRLLAAMRFFSISCATNSSVWKASIAWSTAGSKFSIFGAAGALAPPLDLRLPLRFFSAGHD